MNKPNRLIHEKSPYLLQHAYNLVEWYPWGDEAFEKAKNENKPIFLSIGYSTCYWCHVMEREVFENEEMAKIMNEYFISIKVDREERPDIDRVYMIALQSLTGSGGWPMSMFLTPELKPFYGATYIPPKSKYGIPGFGELCKQIHQTWLQKENELKNAGDKIISELSPNKNFKPLEQSLNNEILHNAFQQFKSIFDEEYGGFGNATKFPRPSVLNLLLRYYYRFKDNDSLRMTVRTLFSMSNGGIFDHLGGGFHRYSVDRFWRVPHFEKMLYDQAQLAISYIETYQVTHDVFFKNTAENILEYVIRKFYHNEGGFYSAEDSESLINAEDSINKEEGAFYVWKKDEIEKFLNDVESEIFCYCYGVGDRGNIPINSDPHNVFTDKNILYAAKSAAEASNHFNISIDEINIILFDAKLKLFEAREKRPHSYLDDKILTSWNGLMISAFTKASRVFENDKYYEIAKKSVDFIYQKLFNKENRVLLHRYRDGESKVEGTLEDYAFFIQALLDIFEAGFEEKYLKIAVELCDKMIEIFYDDKFGGFFDVSGNDKSILIRAKEDYDSAEPSGNSIAIMNLLRLSQLLKNDSYFEKAETSLKYFSNDLNSNPYASTQMLCVLDFYLNKKKQIIITGNKEDEIYKKMLNEVKMRFLPDTILICCERNKSIESIPYLNEIIKPSGKTLAYICENFSCKLPVDNVKDLNDVLMNLFIIS